MASNNPIHGVTKPTRAEVQRCQRQAEASIARRVSFRTVILTLLAVLLVFGFLTLRPQAIGGRLAYVSVHGISMTPSLHNGDLVVVKRQSAYHPGEVVAFRVPAGQPGAGQTVIHRIVGGTASGYVTKGDHNPVPDPWHPRKSNLLGAALFSIPHLAGLAPWLRWVALGVAVLCVLALALSLRRKRRPRHERHRAPAQIPADASPDGPVAVVTSDATVEMAPVPPDESPSVQPQPVVDPERSLDLALATEPEPAVAEPQVPEEGATVAETSSPWEAEPEPEAPSAPPGTSGVGDAVIEPVSWATVTPDSSASTSVSDEPEVADGTGPAQVPDRG